jgi:hypothetical protein
MKHVEIKTEIGEDDQPATVTGTLLPFRQGRSASKWDQPLPDDPAELVDVSATDAAGNEIALTPKDRERVEELLWEAGNDQ